VLISVCHVFVVLCAGAIPAVYMAVTHT